MKKRPAHTLGNSAFTTMGELNAWIDTHQDDGCIYAPSCLRCPFEVCRLELPRITRVRLQQERRDAVRRDRENGMKVAAIAHKHQIALRTVQYILSGK